MSFQAAMSTGMKVMLKRSYLRTWVGCFCLVSLLFDSLSWKELQDLAKDRKDRLLKAEECHKFYRDLTDALGHIEVQFKHK